MDTGGGFQYISLFSVRKCNYPKKVGKTQNSPWIQEAVSNEYPFSESESVIIQRKTSKKLKCPHGYMRPFPIHILFFQSKSVNIQKKTSKAQNSPWMQEAVSNTYPSFQSESVIIGKKRGKSSKVPMDALAGFQYRTLFSVRKCNYTKQVEKTQKSPWIQEAVSNTYPSFQSESLIMQKCRKNSKLPMDS